MSARKITLISFVCVYLFSAFISGKPNPFDWNSVARLVYVLGSFALSIAVCFFTSQK